jgi:Xaa-Pro aminopeptidase
LIDLWAREKTERAIFYDINLCGLSDRIHRQNTWKYSIPSCAPANAARNFRPGKIRRNERCLAMKLTTSAGRWSWMPAMATISCIATGHSIGHCVHGNGVNIDNLETKDEREWCPEFVSRSNRNLICRVRWRASEIDVFITKDREVIVAGDEQAN